VHEINTEAAPASGSVWSGGTRPFAIGSKKFGMWLFLLSDTLTFAALLLTYSYLRLANPDWPRPFEFSPAIINATIMTVILLFSSLTMVLAVAAAHAGERSKAVRYILFTALGGITFDVLHLREWFHLFSEGYGPGKTPEGVPLFGSAFFGITGMHMAHVTIGVIYLSIVAVGFGKGKFTDEDVEVSGLYWHFVDLVWMFVFPMIYLMSIKL
jgi:cytochrome c oxidase subunit 3